MLIEQRMECSDSGISTDEVVVGVGGSDIEWHEVDLCHTVAISCSTQFHMNLLSVNLLSWHFELAFVEISNDSRHGYMDMGGWEYLYYFKRTTLQKNKCQIDLSAEKFFYRKLF